MIVVHFPLLLRSCIFFTMTFTFINIKFVYLQMFLFNDSFIKPFRTSSLVIIPSVITLYNHTLDTLSMVGQHWGCNYIKDNLTYNTMFGNLALGNLTLGNHTLVNLTQGNLTLVNLMVGNLYLGQYKKSYHG